MSLATLAAMMQPDGKVPLIDGLRRNCSHFVNRAAKRPNELWSREYYCDKVSCPGYTLVSEAEAVLVLLEWCEKHHYDVSFMEDRGLCIVTVDSVEGGDHWVMGGYNAETFAAAMYKALGPEVR